MTELNYPPLPTPPVAMKHSTLGIISFVLALVAFLVFCIDLIIVLAMGDKNPANLTFNPIDTVLSCMAGFIALVGLALGIAAVVDKKKKKLFGILGLVFSALYLLAYCVLIGINLIRLAGSQTLPLPAL